jgi:predicted DsbA family dithiol-disulfide isomerase
VSDEGPEQRNAGIRRERIQGRARDVGFIMNTSDSSRVYNTFDAHRLLAWAKATGKQHALKRQLFVPYFLVPGMSCPMSYH